MASARRTGTGENVSTYGNGTRDYSALATWEAATDNDLVTATTSEVLECYADSASFDDWIDMGGATTNASYFRIIRPATDQFHDGTPNSGVVFESADATNAALIRSGENYSSFQDFTVIRTRDTASPTTYAIQLLTTVDFGDIVGCIVTNSNPSGTGHGIGVGGTNCVLRLCIAYNCEDTSFHIYDTIAATVTCQNCTSYGAGALGFSNHAGSTITWQNCAADGSVIADFSNLGTDSGSEANSSSDTTAVGSAAVISQTFSYENTANNNYRWASDDTGALLRGLDLSGTFDDDLLRNTIITPTVGPRIWSIGADSNAAYISSRRRGVGENVSTFGDGTRDYTSLAVWEAATDNDLVTLKVSEVLECYADSSPYSQSTTLATGARSTNYFRIIRAATGNKHGGVPDAGVTFTATSTKINLAEPYAQAQDLQFSGNTSGSGGTNSSPGNNIGWVGIIVDTPLGGSTIGIWMQQTSAVCANCLVYDSGNDGFYGGCTNAYALNCTAVGCTDKGFVKALGNLHVYNCLATGNGTDFGTEGGSWGGTSDYNASSDTTATNPGGLNNQTSVSITYADAGGKNFHLAAADIDVKNLGGDISTFAAYPFTDDIDGQHFTTFSIGWDSIPSAGGGAAAGHIILIRRRRR